MNREHIPTEGEVREIWDRLTKGEESIKSAHQRIDEIKEMSESINKLAISSVQMATELKAIREDNAKVDKRLKHLENQPIKNYNTIVTTVITALCSGAVGFLINSILK